MTSVLVTTDSELSPGALLRSKSASENFDSAILGRVADGERRIPHLVGRLDDYGLKAVFFVEFLCTGAVGIDCLKRAVDPILSSSHEVSCTSTPND